MGQQQAFLAPTLAQLMSNMKNLMRERDTSLDPFHPSMLDTTMTRMRALMEQREEANKYPYGKVLQPRDPEEWDIENVIDGDTVRIRGLGNVRIVNSTGTLDAREMGQLGGDDARQSLVDILNSGANRVRVNRQGRDAYGRNLVTMTMPNGTDVGGYIENAADAIDEKIWQDSPDTGTGMGRELGWPFPHDDGVAITRKKMAANGFLMGLLYPVSGLGIPGIQEIYDKAERENEEYQKQLFAWYDQPQTRELYDLGPRPHSKPDPAQIRAGAAEMTGFMGGIVGPAGLLEAVAWTAAPAVMAPARLAANYPRIANAMKSFAITGAVDGVMAAGAKLEDGQDRSTKILVEGLAGGFIGAAASPFFMNVAQTKELGGIKARKQKVDEIADSLGVTSATADEQLDLLRDMEGKGGNPTVGAAYVDNQSDTKVRTPTDAGGQTLAQLSYRDMFGIGTVEPTLIREGLDGKLLVSLDSTNGVLEKLMQNPNVPNEAAAIQLMEAHTATADAGFPFRSLAGKTEEQAKAIKAEDTGNFLNWMQARRNEGYILTIPETQYANEAALLRLLKDDVLTDKQAAWIRDGNAHEKTNSVIMTSGAVPGVKYPKGDPRGGPGPGRTKTGERLPEATLEQMEAAAREIPGRPRTQEPWSNEGETLVDDKFRGTAITTEAIERFKAKLKGPCDSPCEFSDVEAVMPNWLRKRLEGVSPYSAREGVPFHIGILRDPHTNWHVTSEMYRNMSELDVNMITAEVTNYLGMMERREPGAALKFQDYQSRTLGRLSEGLPVSELPPGFSKTGQWTMRERGTRRERKATAASPHAGIAAQLEDISINPFISDWRQRMFTSLADVGSKQTDMATKYRWWVSVLTDKAQRGQALTIPQENMFPHLKRIQQRVDEATDVPVTDAVLMGSPVTGQRMRQLNLARETRAAWDAGTQERPKIAALRSGFREPQDPTLRRIQKDIDETATEIADLTEAVRALGPEAAEGRRLGGPVSVMTEEGQVVKPGSDIPLSYVGRLEQANKKMGDYLYAREFRSNELVVEDITSAIRSIEKKRATLLAAVADTGPGSKKLSVHHFNSLRDLDISSKKLVARRMRLQEALSDKQPISQRAVFGETDLFDPRDAPVGEIMVREGGKEYLVDAGRVFVAGAPAAKLEKIRILDNGPGDPGQIVIQPRGALTDRLGGNNRGRVFTGTPGKTDPWMEQFLEVDVGSDGDEIIIGWVLNSRNEIQLSVSPIREHPASRGAGWGTAPEGGPLDLMRAAQERRETGPPMGGGPTGDVEALGGSYLPVEMQREADQIATRTGIPLSFSEGQHLRGVPTETQPGRADLGEDVQVLKPVGAPGALDPSQVNVWREVLGPRSENPLAELAMLDFSEVPEDLVHTIVNRIEDLPETGYTRGYADIEGYDVPHTVTYDDVVDGGISLRNMPEGSEVLREYEGQIQLATKMEKAPPQSFMVNKGFFEGKGAMFTSGEAPSYVISFKHAAKALIEQGIDRDYKISLKVAMDNHRYVPDQELVMTLGELADMVPPRATVDRLMDALARRGMTGRPWKAGFQVDNADGTVAHFDETLDALNYIDRIPTNEHLFTDIADSTEQSLGMGWINEIDPEIDQARFGSNMITTELIQETQQGKRAVTEAITADAASFERTFEVANGDLIRTMERKEHRGLRADNDKLVRSFREPREDGTAFSDTIYLTMDPQNGVKVPKGGSRVVVINRPLAERLFRSPEVQNLLPYLGADTNDLYKSIRQLDGMPNGLDIFKEDPTSAAMYTYARIHGLRGWHSKPGRVLQYDASGTRRIFSSAEKAKWEKQNMWTPCRVPATGTAGGGAAYEFDPQFD